MVLGLLAAGLAAPATASAGGWIAGHVTDQDGNALANICIWVTDSNFSTVASDTTDAQGDYTTAVPAGSGYKVRFSDDCGGAGTYANQWYYHRTSHDDADPISVAENEILAGINATLHPGGTISGHVKDASDTPLQNICVWANDAGGKLVGFTSTDAGGDYTLTGMPVGDYTVQFSDWSAFCPGAGDFYIAQWFNGRSSAGSADIVSVTAGQTTSGIDATLALGGQIGGHVTDSANAAVSDICVGALDPNTFAVVGGTRTDSSGDYVIGSLPPGSYLVGFTNWFPPSCAEVTSFVTQFYDNQTWFESPSPVSVDAGSTTPGIDAAMEGNPAAITGHVTDASTHAAAHGVCVGLHLPSVPGITVTVTTDSNGFFQFLGLPAGAYAVSFATCPGGSPTYTPQWFNGKADGGSADTITLATGEVRMDVDAAMQTASTGGTGGGGGGGSGGSSGDTTSTTSPPASQQSAVSAPSTVALPPAVEVVHPAASPCIVPRLRGATLAVARHKLQRAHCRLGKVTRTRSHKFVGRVISTRSPAGSRRTAEARIGVLVGAPATGLR